MVKSAGLAMEFYFSGFDLSGDIGALDSLGVTRTTYEVTGINKSAIERIYGRIDSNLNYTSHFDKATGQQHLAMRTLPRTDINILVALQGGARGSTSAMIIGKQETFGQTRGADGSLTVSGQHLANGKGWEFGTVLLAKATISGTGNSASEDNAAATADGLAAQLHLTAFTGTNYTATIQDSANDCCFTTLKAFAQITAINQSERVTVAGEVLRHMRVNHAGTFTSVAVVVATRRGSSLDKEAYAN